MRLYPWDEKVPIKLLFPGLGPIIVFLNEAVPVLKIAAPCPLPGTSGPPTAKLFVRVLLLIFNVPLLRIAPPSFD